eukprot:6236156-Amphidinium_carterae.2
MEVRGNRMDLLHAKCRTLESAVRTTCTIAWQLSVCVLESGKSRKVISHDDQVGRKQQWPRVIGGLNIGGLGTKRLQKVSAGLRAFRSVPIIEFHGHMIYIIEEGITRNTHASANASKNDSPIGRC